MDYFGKILATDHTLVSMWYESYLEEISISYT